MKKEKAAKKAPDKGRTAVTIIVLISVIAAATALILTRCSFSKNENLTEEKIPAVIETAIPELKPDESPKTKPQNPAETAKAQASPEPEENKPEVHTPVSPEIPPQSGNAGGDLTRPETPDNTEQEEVPQHFHSWQPVYTVIKHEEKGHMETVVISPAWDEDEMEWVTVCNVCGYVGADVPEHIVDAHDNNGSYHSEPRPTGNKIHHEAVSEEQWIVDSPAYDEQVIAYYICSCGETKSA